MKLGHWIIGFLIVSCAACQSSSGGEADDHGRTGKQIPTVDIESADSMITIDLPAGELNKELRMSSVIDSVWYVKLETSAESLIGTISELIIQNDQVYILDKKNKKGVYQFDLDGNFIRRFGKEGKGPGEYLRPLDFTVNPVTEEVIVYGDKLSRLIVYDRNGNHVRTSKVTFRTREILALDSNTYLFNNKTAPNGDRFKDLDDYFLTLTDIRAKPVAKALQFDMAIKNLRYGDSPNLVRDGDQVYYHPAMSDTIYAVSMDKIVPRVALNFGEKSLPQGFAKGINYKQFRETYQGKKEYAFLLGKYFFVDDKIYLGVSTDGVIVKVVYSLTTGEMRYGGKLYSDLEGHFGHFSPQASYKDFLVSVVHSDQVPKGEDINDQKLRELVENTSITDNPILCFQRIKAF